MRTFLKVLHPVIHSGGVLPGPHTAAAAAAGQDKSLERRASTCTKLGDTDRPTVTHAPDEEG